MFNAQSRPAVGSLSASKNRSVVMMATPAGKLKVISTTLLKAGHLYFMPTLLLQIRGNFTVLKFSNIILAITHFVHASGGSDWRWRSHWKPRHEKTFGTQR